MSSSSLSAQVAAPIDSSGSSGEGITVGVTGQLWRATVSPWGSVTPWPDEATDGPAPTLDWYIAADDRWHIPASEAAVRQHRPGGAPVTETRVRIPDGDAVQRVWSVANAGGLTIIEVENDSPLPIAVAYTGLDVVTERPTSPVPIQGIDLPQGAITLPIGHHASVRVAIPHAGSHAAAGSPAALLGAPDQAVVVSGWQTIAERASRLDLPDDGLAHAIVAARADLMLNGPVDAGVDAVGFVLDVAELVRLGEDAGEWLPEIVEPLESVARGSDPQLRAALVGAERVASMAGDRRAGRDLARLSDRLGAPTTMDLSPFSEVRRAGSVGRFINEVERRLASGADLLPMGIPTSWLGANFELHGVPTSATSAVSFAVRWHGDRPAVLWEQTGEQRRLTAGAIDPAWSADEMTGETLWAAQQRPAARSTPLGLTVDTAGPASAQPGSDTSFS